MQSCNDEFFDKEVITVRGMHFIWYDEFLKMNDTHNLTFDIVGKDEICRKKWREKIK